MQMLTWSVTGTGAVTSQQANYSFAIDNFSIVKDTLTIVDDNMSSAPVAGGGDYAVGVNGTTGVLTSGLDPNDPNNTRESHLPRPQHRTAVDVVQHRRCDRRQWRHPADRHRWHWGDTLTKESNFDVTGKFDLIAPNDIGESYGIRLTDRQPGVAVGDAFGGGISGNDTVELRVVEGYSGSVQVQLRQLNFITNTATVLQSFGLNNFQPGEQIALTLSHSSSDPNAIVASYDLFDANGVQLDANGSASGMTRTFANPTTPATIFSDEDFTQAQIHAGSLATDLSYLATDYGAFSIDPNTGAWNYSLHNGADAVQNLGASSSVPQDFTVQVADDQGATATTSADFTVNGINDAPALVLSTVGGVSATEQIAVALAPALTLSDIDSTTLLSATVQITGNYLNGEDVLSFTDPTGKIAGSFNTASGNALTLTAINGQTPTDADFQAALGAVAYTDTSDAPSTAARTVTFTVQDPDGTANGGADTDSEDDDDPCHRRQLRAGARRSGADHLVLRRAAQSQLSM